MIKKYQMFIKKHNTIYCNYYSNKKDLQQAIDYFTNKEKIGYDNLQVNIKISGGKWYVFGTDELLEHLVDKRRKK